MAIRVPRIKIPRDIEGFPEERSRSFLTPEDIQAREIARLQARMYDPLYRERIAAVGTSTEAQRRRLEAAHAAFVANMIRQAQDRINEVMEHLPEVRSVEDGIEVMRVLGSLANEYRFAPPEVQQALGFDRLREVLLSPQESTALLKRILASAGITGPISLPESVPVEPEVKIEGAEAKPPAEPTEVQPPAETPEAQPPAEPRPVEVRPPETQPTPEVKPPPEAPPPTETEAEEPQAREEGILGAVGIPSTAELAARNRISREFWSRVTSQREAQEKALNADIDDTLPHFRSYVQALASGNVAGAAVTLDAMASLLEALDGEKRYGGRLVGIVYNLFDHFAELVGGQLPEKIVMSIGASVVDEANRLARSGLTLDEALKREGERVLASLEGVNQIARRRFGRDLIDIEAVAKGLEEVAQSALESRGRALEEELALRGERARVTAEGRAAGTPPKPTPEPRVERGAERQEEEVPGIKSLTPGEVQMILEATLYKNNQIVEDPVGHFEEILEGGGPIGGLLKGLSPSELRHLRQIVARMAMNIEQRLTGAEREGKEALGRLLNADVPQAMARQREVLVSAISSDIERLSQIRNLAPEEMEREWANYLADARTLAASEEVPDDRMLAGTFLFIALTADQRETIEEKVEHAILLLEGFRDSLNPRPTAPTPSPSTPPRPSTLPSFSPYSPFFPRVVSANPPR